MYNREKIIQTLRDIKAEADTVEPYVIIAQPRRSKNDPIAQSFNGYGLNHVDVMGHSFGYVDVEGELVDVARNYLIERAMSDSNAKYLFFIGDDTVVPYDAFEILHKTAKENPRSIVTGVYYIKCSHAMISAKEDNYIVVPNVDPGQVFEAWQTGMDCMLIPLDLLREMRDKEPDLPFCCIANGIEDIPFVGEDNFFVHRIRKHGIKLLVNTDVQCLHMDVATGKYTAHPDVNLNKYYTNIKPAGVLTIDDKKFIDYRWFSRLPGSENSPKGGFEKWLPGQDIPDLIKDVKNPIGVEIGSAEGTTTEYLLSTIDTLKLTSIDPYTRYIDWDDKQPACEENRVQLLQKTEAYADRFTLVEKTSDDAVSQFKDASLDFVFVDGLHTYEQVKKDCDNYWPKIKKGGLLIGHDFARIEGVNKAANEFSDKVGIAIRNAKQDLWYIVKE
jgi:predicted O-methyltransferase YrrM